MFKDLIHGARTLMRTRAGPRSSSCRSAWHRRQYRAVSAVNSLFLKKLEVRGSRHAGAAEMGRQERHGHRLQRLRLLHQGRRRRDRPQHVLLPDVPAVRRRQPDSDDPLPARAYSRANVVVDGAADVANAFVTRATTIACSACRRILDASSCRRTTSRPPLPSPSSAPGHWRSRFGGDPRTVGKVVLVNNVPVTIVGVIRRSSSTCSRRFVRGPTSRCRSRSSAVLEPPTPPGEPALLCWRDRRIGGCRWWAG